MNTHALETIIGRFPRHIQFPRIERLHRSSRKSLADIRSVDDLPSRLIFGDLIQNSFVASPDGWTVKYQDDFGNGLDLSVTDRRFSARPKFLGSEGLSNGPLTPPQAFVQLLNLGSDGWDRILKDYVEQRYPVTVAPHDREMGSTMYVPDGWLRSIFVPVAPWQLPDLLAWHLALGNDKQLGASQSGGVSLAFNAVNYIEGRCSEECSDANLLLVRSLLSTGTPLVAPVLREEANDGSAALTVRRMAYVYHLTAFMRDIPHLLQSLDEAGFLSREPDQWSAVAPAEAVVAAQELRWFSQHRECNITWAGLDDQAIFLMGDFMTDLPEPNLLVGEALAAAREFEDFMGLREQIEEASSNRQEA